MFAVVEGAGRLGKGAEKAMRTVLCLWAFFIAFRRNAARDELDDPFLVEVWSDVFVESGPDERR